MIMRILLSVMMLLGLAGFGTIAFVTLGPARHAEATAPQAVPVNVTLVAAAHSLRAGVLLKPDDLTGREVPRSQMPEGAAVDTPAARIGMVGSMVRRAVAAGAPFAGEDLLHPGEHGFLAAVLRPGTYAVTVGVDAVSGSAGLIWPGDNVDVILTQVLELANLPPGRREAAETVLQNVRVIAIDQLLAGAPPSGTEAQNNNRTVTLEVSSSGAEKVQVASRIGRLSLVVRATDPGLVLGGAANKVPTWASDVSPALGGTVQPSGPSVVRVFTGSAEGKEFRF
jgi:pilus assembly protein CpaB